MKSSLLKPNMKVTPTSNLRKKWDKKNLEKELERLKKKSIKIRWKFKFFVLTIVF